ncbi:M13 family metallopeptidase [Reichenbachiella sp.]|uniref:M13 family metallopeptidase n=1 Tax=Reichenbachiella sp. TaxID=2184521 RepID=UPI003B5CF090
MKNISCYFLFLSLVVSCADKKPTENLPKRQYVDVSGLDVNVKPGDNFFKYVNGLWHDTARIADDQSGVGSYRFLNIPQKVLLRNILEELASAEYTHGSIEQQVGDFYASGMDTISINQLGYTPIRPTLNNIESIKNVADLMRFIADDLKSGVYSIISLGIYPDQANSNVNIAHFSQTGLGLPDRDYYFKTDSSSVAIQQAYQAYLQNLFELTEAENAKSLANTVYGIEKQLAESHKTRIERRDVKANYNKLSLKDLDQRQPNIGWSALLKKLGMETDSVDVRQPAYYDRVNAMLETVSVEDWKTYLTANTIATNASVLSKDFESAEFEYTKLLSGQSTQKSRAERMVQMVDRRLGFALGQVYVKRHFNEDAKKRALQLVNNLQKAFEMRIDQLDWMSDSTKVKAKEKLYAITKKIGYPDVWREYKGIVIDKSKYFENVVELRKELFRYNVAKLNKAPNREEWRTTPSTVTAYYMPPLNEIVFPAGILQYPYFDLYADDAINYGGIGMVIGHELTHAFDDQGAQYDKDGNVKNWWTEQDYEKFKARTQKMIDLYSTFTVLDSVALKGALTVGENTADNGGMAIAYDAFKMTEQGQDTTRIDGFTPDQRFFLSVGRIWRVKMREEFLRNYVAVDPHSPAMWRVNGPLMNFTPFYEAFDVKPGDENYRPLEDRVSIW